MRKKLLTIMLIFAIAMCGCENNSDEEEKNTTETEGFVTTQYDL